MNMLRFTKVLAVSVVLSSLAVASVYAAVNVYSSQQAESATRSGNAALVSDSSASGSSAIKFVSPATVNCIGATNEPGGPDPWGGCWPGEYNTGYPHGLPGDTRTPVTLTNYTGPQEIRSCGVVIENKIVPWLVILAGNGTHSKDTPCVTIRNSLVETVYTETTEQGPLLIEDSEVNLDNKLPYIENVGRSNTFVYRVNSHGGGGGIRCAGYCEVKDSWVHGAVLGGDPGYHYNAIGGNGMYAGSWNIEHNYASCGDWQSEQSPGYDAGCSAVIGFYGDFAPIRNITINRNFLRSSFVTGAQEFRQSAYCLNPGYYPGKPYPDTSNMTVTDNIFHRGLSGKCGVYGPTNSLNKIGQGATNIWSGNRYTDGTIINRIEE